MQVMELGVSGDRGMHYVFWLGVGGFSLRYLRSQRSFLRQELGHPEEEMKYLK